MIIIADLDTKEIMTLPDFEVTEYGVAQAIKTYAANHPERGTVEIQLLQRKGLGVGLLAIWGSK